MGIAELPRDAGQPLVRSLSLRQIALDDGWAERRVLIDLRDAKAVPRHVRLLIDHLCVAPAR